MTRWEDEADEQGFGVLAILNKQRQLSVYARARGKRNERTAAETGGGYRQSCSLTPVRPLVSRSGRVMKFRRCRRAGSFRFLEISPACITWMHDGINILPGKNVGSAPGRARGRVWVARRRKRRRRRRQALLDIDSIRFRVSPPRFLPAHFQFILDRVFYTRLFSSPSNRRERRGGRTRAQQIEGKFVSLRERSLGAGED